VIDQAYTGSQIGTLLLEAEADGWAPRQWPNKEARLQHVFSAMREDDGEEAQNAALELLRLVLRKGAPRSEWGSPAVWWTELVEAAAADGWEYDVDEGRLVPTVPGVQVAEETAHVEAELRRRGWTTAAGHYRQALAGFAADNWASANGQLRSLLEEVIPTAAESVAGRRPKEVQAALDLLLKKGVLVDGEYGLVKGMWELSQSRGPHPGFSDKEEATFRLISITAYCRFLLSRLPDSHASRSSRTEAC
jgi:hypothetical protein